MTNNHMIKTWAEQFDTRSIKEKIQKNHYAIQKMKDFQYLTEEELVLMEVNPFAEIQSLKRNTSIWEQVLSYKEEQERQSNLA